MSDPAVDPAARANVEGTGGCSGAAIGVAPGAPATTRRGVLATSVVAAAGLGLAACSGGEPKAAPLPSPKPSGKGTAVMKADQLAVGAQARAPYGATQVLLYRASQDEVAAFDATCPHAGCQVGTHESSDEFECPCHHSIFRQDDGAVVSGPATTSLKRLAARVQAGNIVVFG